MSTIPTKEDSNTGATIPINPLGGRGGSGGFVAQRKPIAELAPGQIESMIEQLSRMSPRDFESAAGAPGGQMMPAGYGGQQFSQEQVIDELHRALAAPYASGPRDGQYPDSETAGNSALADAFIRNTSPSSLAGGPQGEYADAPQPRSQYEAGRAAGEAAAQAKFGGTTPGPYTWSNVRPTPPPEGLHPWSAQIRPASIGPVTQPTSGGENSPLRESIVSDSQHDQWDADEALAPHREGLLGLLSRARISYDNESMDLDDVVRSLDSGEREEIELFLRKSPLSPEGVYGKGMDAWRAVLQWEDASKLRTPSKSEVKAFLSKAREEYAVNDPGTISRVGTRVEDDFAFPGTDGQAAVLYSIAALEKEYPGFDRHVDHPYYGELNAQRKEIADSDKLWSGHLYTQARKDGYDLFAKRFADEAVKKWGDHTGSIRHTSEMGTAGKIAGGALSALESYAGNTGLSVLGYKGPTGKIPLDHPHPVAAAWAAYLEGIGPSPLEEHPAELDERLNALQEEDDASQASERTQALYVTQMKGTEQEPVAEGKPSAAPGRSLDKGSGEQGGEEYDGSGSAPLSLEDESDLSAWKVAGGAVGVAVTGALTAWMVPKAYRLVKGAVQKTVDAWTHRGMPKSAVRAILAMRKTAAEFAASNPKDAARAASVLDKSVEHALKGASQTTANAVLATLKVESDAGSDAATAALVKAKETVAAMFPAAAAPASTSSAPGRAAAPAAPATAAPATPAPATPAPAATGSDPGRAARAAAHNTTNYLVSVVVPALQQGRLIGDIIGEIKNPVVRAEVKEWYASNGDMNLTKVAGDAAASSAPGRAAARPPLRKAVFEQGPPAPAGEGPPAAKGPLPLPWNKAPVTASAPTAAPEVMSHAEQVKANPAAVSGGSPLNPGGPTAPLEPILRSQSQLNGPLTHMLGNVPVAQRNEYNATHYISSVVVPALRANHPPKDIVNGIDNPVLRGAVSEWFADSGYSLLTAAEKEGIHGVATRKAEVLSERIKTDLTSKISALLGVHGRTALTNGTPIDDVVSGLIRRGQVNGADLVEVRKAVGNKAFYDTIEQITENARYDTGPAPKSPPRIGLDKTPTVSFSKAVNTLKVFEYVPKERVPEMAMELVASALKASSGDMKAAIGLIDHGFGTGDIDPKHSAAVVKIIKQHFGGEVKDAQKRDPKVRVPAVFYGKPKLSPEMEAKIEAVVTSGEASDVTRQRLEKLAKTLGLPKGQQAVVVRSGVARASAHVQTQPKLSGAERADRGHAQLLDDWRFLRAQKASGKLSHNQFRAAAVRLFRQIPPEERSQATVGLGARVLAMLRDGAYDGKTTYKANNVKWMAQNAAKRLDARPQTPKPKTVPRGTSKPRGR